MKQTSFFAKPQTQYGGSLRHRKTARILDSRRPLHLVLKAKKQFILLKHSRLFYAVLRKQAKTFGVKIYSSSLQRDHFHLCLKITNRQLYKGFIRAVTGILARKIARGLWRFLPYTRVLEWRRDFENTKIYILKNDLELLCLEPRLRGPPV